MDLVQGVLESRPRAIARAISLVEDEDPERELLIDALFPHTGRARVWGVTGSPGAGKSTLVDRLITRERRAGGRVAVVCVDPSSPFTGGALLGDRLRMQEHAADPEVFIRSMASRGHLGGVSQATGDAVRVLDAASYDTILVETIGVGQAEIEVVELSDLVLLILVPGLGDEIQVMKAGIMEIGDLFIVNKSDLDGADRLKSEIDYVLGLKNHDPGEENNPVLLVSARRDEGIDELVQAACAWQERLRASGALQERRRKRLEGELRRIFSRKLHALLEVKIELSQKLAAWSQSLAAGKATPYALINEELKTFLKERGNP